jgi:hypothetical protein
MAELGYAESDWSLVYAMVKKGLAITEPSGSYLVEPTSWGYALYDFGSISAFRLGLIDEAYEFAKTACKLNDVDPRLTHNLALIEAQLKRGELHESI